MELDPLDDGEGGLGLSPLSASILNPQQQQRGSVGGQRGSEGSQRGSEVGVKRAGSSHSQHSRQGTLQREARTVRWRGGSGKEEGGASGLMHVCAERVGGGRRSAGEYEGGTLIIRELWDREISRN